MTGTTLAAFVSVVLLIVGGYVTSIVYFVGRIDRRLERIEDRLEKIEDRLTALEVSIGKIGQRLDDHIANHPGPTETLARPR